MVGKEYDLAVNGPVLIVLCHGFKSNKDNVLLSKLYSDLCKKGHSVLKFTFSNYSEKTISINAQAIELKRMIKKVSNKNKFSKVILVGYSFGGSVVLTLASQKNKLSHVLLIAPVTDFEEFISITQKRRWNLDITRKHPLFREFDEAKKSWSKCKAPVLSIHGTNDDVVPHHQSTELKKILADFKLMSVEGQNHSFEGAESVISGKISEVVA